MGGHIALNISDYGNKFEVAGLLDDDPDKIGKELFGYPVVGPIDEALNFKDVNIVVGISFPEIKRQVIHKLIKNQSLAFPTLLHRNAWISEGVSVGLGSVIYPGNCINYGSEIGDFVVMNMNCSLGHHTKIGSFTSLAPGVNTGGHTQIGQGVDVGIGVSTIQNVKIGDQSVIGGQSMVIREVMPESTVMGIPAREKP